MDYPCLVFINSNSLAWKPPGLGEVDPGLQAQYGQYEYLIPQAPSIDSAMDIQFIKLGDQRQV